MEFALRPPVPAGPHLVVGLARSGAAAALALSARGEQVIGVDAGAPAGTEALQRAGVEVHLGDSGIAMLARAGARDQEPGRPAQAP